MAHTKKPLNDYGGNRPNDRADDRRDKLKIVIFATVGGILGALITHAFLFGVVFR